MKPFDYYSKPQTLYPNKKDYITLYAYDKGQVVSKSFGFQKSKRQLMDEYPNAVIQEVLNEESYKAHQKQYGEEKHKLHEEFMNDLFEEFGVSDNPKRYKVFLIASNIAWEKGHGNDLKEVYNKFYDLVELIKD
jgi:Tol biopolymer transport system component